MVSGNSSYLATQGSNLGYATFFHLCGFSSCLYRLLFYLYVHLFFPRAWAFSWVPLRLHLKKKEKKTKLILNFVCFVLVGGPHAPQGNPVGTTSWHVKRLREQMTCSTNAAFKILWNFHVMTALVGGHTGVAFSDMNLLLMKFILCPWWLFYNGVNYLPLRNPSHWHSSNPIKSGLLSTFNWLITNNYCWNQL